VKLVVDKKGKVIARAEATSDYSTNTVEVDDIYLEDKNLDDYDITINDSGMQITPKISSEQIKKRSYKRNFDSALTLEEKVDILAAFMFNTQ
jgi:hypothetical protein